MQAPFFKKKTRIAAAGAAVIFFIVIVAAGRTRPVSSVRAYGIQLLSPIANFGASVGEYVAGAPGREKRMWNEDQRRLAAAEAQVFALQKDNKSLRRLLGLKEGTAAPLVSVRVLAYTSIMGMETLLINAGADQGIQEDDIVIDENRLLVGLVSEVNATDAKVSIASNTGMAFSASLLPLGGRVLAKGLGGRAVALELIPYDTPLRDGDLALWADERRRGDLVIFAGRVVKGMSAAAGAFKTARAVLLSNPDALKNLLVLINR